MQIREKLAAADGDRCKSILMMGLFVIAGADNLWTTYLTGSGGQNSTSRPKLTGVQLGGCRVVAMPNVVESGARVSIAAVHSKESEVIAEFPAGDSRMVFLPSELSAAPGFKCRAENVGSRVISRPSLDLQVQFFHEMPRALTTEPDLSRIVRIRRSRIAPHERFNVYLTNLCPDAWIIVKSAGDPIRSLRAPMAMAPTQKEMRDAGLEMQSCLG